VGRASFRFRSQRDVARNHHAMGKFRPFKRISLTVQEGRRFNEAIAQDQSMFFEAITAFFVVLSVGILIAHALDAFRPWT
jgi:hypothetical protein